MDTLAEVVLLLACIGSGLVAGLCFAFAAFVLRALGQLGPESAIRAMQAINTTILRSSAMVVWMGTAGLGVAGALLADGETTARGVAISGALLYACGALVVTRVGNIPHNEALDRVDVASLEAAEARRIWERYHVRWQRWNVLRTLTCAFATGAFALAL